MPISFRICSATEHFEDPATQAEYIYSLVEEENE